MDSKNQLQYFCLSVVIAFLGGISYEIFAFFRWVFGCKRGKNKIVGGILDCLFFLILSIFCIFSMNFLHFPTFRAYFLLGFALGGWIYAKTLRRIVAFCQKVCYNVITKSVKAIKAKKKLSNSGG